MKTLDPHDADDALRALVLPFARGVLRWPADGRVLFLGARAGVPLRKWPTSRWVCQQGFKPFADELARAGMTARASEPAADERFACVLLLPPRQRDERRALLARAWEHAAPGAPTVVAVANREGARSAQADMARLVGPVQSLSKYRCRVFWHVSGASTVHDRLLHAWRDFDALRPSCDGMVSRPGLFAWDHVDPASSLLAAHLPPDLHGRAADLGAGAGWLSTTLLRRCENVESIDLYEADARALPAARANLQHTLQGLRREVAAEVHWHDVTAGVPGEYDVIVSNPPFHQGHAGQPQLGRAFIVAAAAALRPGGAFWMVANRHLPYETTLRSAFARVVTHVERDGFKVIEARR